MDSLKFLSQLNSFFSNFLVNLLGSSKASSCKCADTILWGDITSILSNVGNVAAKKTDESFKKIAERELKICGDLRKLSHFFGISAFAIGKNKTVDQVKLIVDEIASIAFLFIKVIKAEAGSNETLSMEKLALAKKSLDFELKRLNELKD